MSILTRNRRRVQTTPSLDPWAAFDEWTWELGPAPEDAGEYEAPTDADRLWAAEHLNDEADGHPVIEAALQADEAAYWAAESARHDAAEAMLAQDLALLEEMAEESAAMDRLERGLCC